MGNKANTGKRAAGGSDSHTRLGAADNGLVIRYKSETKPEDEVLLTTSNLMRVLEYVWGAEEKIDSKWRILAGDEMLKIHPSKVQELTRDCTNDRQRMSALIEFWLTWCPNASWRWWVEYFEGHFYWRKAQAMCKYAEPISDPTLTVENVQQVFDQWIGSQQFDTTKFFRHHKKAQPYADDLAKWWLATVSNPSWESLAETFCKLPRNTLVKQYIKRSVEPSLTVDNLKAVLAPIEDWEKFARLLNISPSKLRQIGFHSSQADKREVVLQEFLDNHPAPSWKRVASAVYEMAFFENCYSILEVIRYKYINDFNLQNLCIFAVRNFLKSPVDDVHYLPLPEQIKSLISQ